MSEYIAMLLARLDMPAVEEALTEILGYRPW